MQSIDPILEPTYSFMKIYIKVEVDMKLMCLTVLLVSGFCFASPPTYTAPVSVYASGELIDVGFYAAPCVSDWNGDGVKDLILGDGIAMRFYQNENTNDSPVFNAYTLLESDGSVIYHNYGAWGPINPQVADWNGDGFDDLLTGDCRGNVTYYQRNGSGVNDLECQGFLSSVNGSIDVGANSAPVVVDWNSDGLLDLVVGCENTEYGLGLYLNSGTVSNPTLGARQIVQSSDSPIAHYRCCPQVYDMNLDGKKDLILGASDAQVYYYENTGSQTDPLFSGFETIQSNGSPIDLSSETRLWVDDWNEDGIPDLLISDYNGILYLYIAQDTGIEHGGSISGLSEFRVLPESNPTTGMLRIILQQAHGLSSVTVYDSAGRAVVNTISSETSLLISTASFPAGVYTVIAENGENVASCRIVVTD